MINRRRHGIVRFAITNGIPLTTLLAVAYYAGIFAKQTAVIENVHVQLAADVAQIKTNVNQVSVDVAILKTKVETLERRRQ